MNSELLLPTKDDIAFYEKNGFWISKKVIDDVRLERLKERMERIYHGEFDLGERPWGTTWQYGDNPRALRKNDNTHLADRAMQELATDPIVGEIAATLVQTHAIRLWVTQLLYKPNRDSGNKSANVGWHQDLSYWNCMHGPTVFTAWVAFDDVNLDNGCMKMVPESHRWGVMNGSDFFDQDLKKQEERMRLPDGKNFEPVPIILKAGQISFHHALTIHGSGPNVSSGPRRSMAIHFMAGDTRYKTGTPWDQNPHFPSFAKFNDGDLIQGEEFPVVYQK